MDSQPLNQESPWWEYAAEDFLEMKCRLSEANRRYLIRELQKKENVRESEELQSHFAFSIKTTLVSIMRGAKIKECWIYYPAENRIERYAPEEKSPMLKRVTAERF